MILPSNVKIEFPFDECQDCDRCEPVVISNDVQNLVSQNLNYVPGHHYTEYYIVKCGFEDACERLVEMIGNL